MLIRIRGYRDGIKDYLEKGQKQDREFERDSMDERVILSGDLELTNDVIQSMDTEADRYINVTISFKEDEIPREVLGSIVREFEAFAFSAYRRDEYNFYAEAHIPRIKSYVDRREGDLVERKVHIHVVIPEVNLLTGRRLEPFGKGDRNQRYLEAFQEHINAKYGLASPKDNRRVEFTDASEMISRYKGDVFEPMNRELKTSILEAVLTRDVQDYNEFRSLLKEFGATRTRNAGREGAYENVKPAGAAKGVNLKEFVFSRSFIELDSDEKRAALNRQEQPQYTESGVPRATPQAYLDALAEWDATRAKEIKYLNSGSSFYDVYQAASPDEQRQILENREQRHYELAGGIDDRSRSGDRRSGDRRDFRSQRYEPEHRPASAAGRTRDGADRDVDAGFSRRGTSAEPAHRMRDVPGRRLDGDATRSKMFLPADALLELGDDTSDRTDALRRTGDLGRRPVVPEIDAPGEGILLPGAAADRGAGRVVLARITARMYESWDTADDDARARLVSTAAAKLRYDSHTAEANGHLDGISVLDRFQRAEGVGPSQGIRGLADVLAFDAIELLPFEGPVDEPVESAIESSVSASPRRQADTVRDQYVVDLDEWRHARGTGKSAEFAEIRKYLDASRLLSVLAHSHGVLVGKYTIGKGEDGGDRIRVGRRNLNVSDFLTKEMSLSWSDAAQVLRETWRAQIDGGSRPVSSRVPTRDLWNDFREWRQTRQKRMHGSWDEQLSSEKTRRLEIRSAFYSARGKLMDQQTLPVRQRREQFAAERVKRIEAEDKLRHVIADERSILRRESRRPASELYDQYLRERAQAGDDRALAELRRMQRNRRLQSTVHLANYEVLLHAASGIKNRSDAASHQNELLYHGPSISYEVRTTGEVDYQKDGTPFMVDEGRSLRLWSRDRGAIEIALRFAQQKFGSSLSLTGPEDFQAEVASVAAVTHMRIVFEDTEPERIRHLRATELAADKQTSWPEEPKRTETRVQRPGASDEIPLRGAEQPPDLGH